jgi:hypothetical protein
MATLKTLGLVIGIAYAASSFALAQLGDPAMNAAASGGSGTHHDSLRTGSAENTQKVTRNQNGYRGLYAYYGGPYWGLPRRRRHYRLFSYYRHPIWGLRHHYHHHWS